MKYNLEVSEETMGLVYENLIRGYNGARAASSDMDDYQRRTDGYRRAFMELAGSHSDVEDGSWRGDGVQDLRNDTVRTPHNAVKSEVVAG